MTPEMVSIVVPVYKAEKYIIKTIESVAAQTYTNWELLLVDDCGGDSSADLIQAYMEENPEFSIRLLRQPQNGGAAAARNRGVKEARGQYLAFLDADDLWLPEKLETELEFMRSRNAGFVFSAYEFGDENAQATGKRVHVPKLLTYKKALSRTVIFTSTVLFDLEIIEKDLIEMPSVPSEDTATWWKILRAGHKAYGLDQPLVIYRRPEESLSSDKKEAVRRIWNLYRNQEQLNLLSALWMLAGWAFRATIRRVFDDKIYTHLGAIRRFVVLQLNLLGLILDACIFAYFWFDQLYPVLSMTRYTRQGKNIGIGIKLYFRGHILMLFIYLVILIALTQSVGGLKTGYLRPGRVFSSQIVALVIANTVTYFQLSFMKNWLFPIQPFLQISGLQIVLSGLWAYLGDRIYRQVFPARDTLVVDLTGQREENLAEISPEPGRRNDANRGERNESFQSFQRATANDTYDTITRENRSEMLRAASGCDTGISARRNDADNKTMRLEEVSAAGQSAISGDASEFGSTRPAQQMDQLDDDIATESILARLSSRPDRFNVLKVMRNATMAQIRRECVRWYGCVVIYGGRGRARKELLEYCNRRYIRVYLVPEIDELLIQGMLYMDLFDAPMLELKEYNIRWEAALAKRIIDIVLGLLGLVLCVPLMLVNLLRGKQMQSGIYAGRYGRPFRRYWYDTKFGHLLDFYSVLCGTMSMVGPHAVPKEKADQLVRQNDRYTYCYRLKPGMTGYSQLNSSPETTDYEHLKMDIYYGQHFSLLNDFKLIIQSCCNWGR